jgi:integrase
LRVSDIDLLAGELHIRHTWQREGGLKPPKTAAGRRTVPLSPGLVDLFINLIPPDADGDHFVFPASGNRRRPVSYWNFRRRGFEPAIEAAGLGGLGITIHGLRSAAVSLYAARGLTILETAAVMGQKDALVTWRHYARLFDKSDVNARVRAAQSSIEVGG